MIQQPSPYPEILLPIAGKQQFIRIEDIVYLEAKGSYTVVFLYDGRKSRLSKKLKSTVEALDHPMFVRIHHSYVINLVHAGSLKSGVSATIQMNNGVELPLSRSRKTAFLDFFKRL